MRLRPLLAPAASLVLAAGLLAHVRMVHPSNGKPLFWSAASSIDVVINDAGSDDVPDASDETALRLAIAEWNAVPGTTAHLVEDTNPASRARTDWDSSNVHMLFFDETGTSGYFPGGSGIVAITPVWFFSGGSISDADVLFNGDDHHFTTSQVPNRFDVRDVATHELGHLLGIDHSPWAGATMYPYVDPTVILHRSLSADEVHALRDAYPDATFGRITGRIERLSNATSVVGAHVVARDAAGRTAASILTTSAGSFTIKGLDAGDYTVYVVPLGDGSNTGSDAPVDASNLSSWYTIQTDFQAATYAQTAAITGGNTVALGTLAVGADVPLNLGRETDRFPVRVVPGTSSTVLLRGAGLSAQSTLSASDPDFLVTSPMWFGSQVSFQVTVPAGEAPGHVDLTVVNELGETTILPAALEVAAASPTVATVSPASGGASGGTPVTLAGTGFNPGARVVLGDQIYTDGVGGTTVVDASTIQLTTQPTITGTHDVVVIDATGVEGRKTAAFQVLAIPTLTSVFPGAGDALGGTEVVLAGEDFEPGVVVRIGGLDQGPVTYESSTLIRFTTLGGAPGAQVLEVENTDGGLTSSSFSYAPQGDPSVSTVAPSSGRKAGGQTITVSGANFSAAAEVLFEVDPDTGAGGTVAASVTFVDAATLTVVTPAFATKGAKSVCVRDGATGQAGVLAGAFLVTAPGGGGGGCSLAPFDEPEAPRAALAGAWWLALVLLVLALRARRPTARTA